MSSMRWDYTYTPGQWQWSSKQLAEKLPQGTAAMSFWARSDKAGPLIVQLEEAKGEAFYVTVELGPDWKQVRTALKDMAVDPNKRQDGVLSSDQVHKIILADPAATGKATGKRAVWLADWRF
jgi:hypothetical protein